MADRPGTFAVLRRPSFAWFLTGSMFINAAFWIQQVTLSWLVYDLTDSGAMLGALNLVRYLATLGLATVAGVAIDRLPKRGMLYATTLWLLVVCLGFGLVLLGDPTAVWILLLYNFLSGIGSAFSSPLRQTVLFSTVDRPLMPSAVALVQTGWAVMRSVGPGIGGFLVLWFGPAGNFFVQAGAYALVMLTIVNLHLREAQPLAAPAAAERAPDGRGSFREGLAYVLAAPTTRVFMLLSWTLPLFIVPNFDALPPIYAKDVFAGGPDTLGMLLSAVGVGGIVGGFVTASLGSLERRGLLQLAALFCLGLTFAGYALSSSLWVAVVLMAVAGFFEMFFLTTNTTLIQLSIPDALRGRVTGIASLSAGLMPVGAYIAGIGADLVGPRTMTLVFSGVLVTIAVVVYVASPVVRDYRLSDYVRDQGV